jgi:diguanylate cyclase (GGDEF)-like protein
MDPLTLAVAGLTTAAGFGTGWHWHRQARQAQAEADRLRGALLAERHAASHDPLAGLPNRRAFYHLGATLITDPRRPNLLAALLDLDNFKQINDRYGHAAGDEVLVAVARRFAIFAGSDLVARLGGDEFAGLLTSPSVEERWLRHAEQRLAAALGAPVPVAGGAAVVVTASVGLVPVRGATDLADVLHRADEAMYRAKARRARTPDFAALPSAPGRHFYEDDITLAAEWLGRHTRPQQTNSSPRHRAPA